MSFCIKQYQSGAGSAVPFLLCYSTVNIPREVWFPAYYEKNCESAELWRRLINELHRSKLLGIKPVYGIKARCFSAKHL